jgi:hypothetical protein
VSAPPLFPSPNGTGGFAPPQTQNQPPQSQPLQSQPSRRRSSRLLVVAVLLGVTGMLLGWFVYQQATDRTPVVAVARPVSFGQEITAADVREALLPSGTDVSTIAWADLDAVVGRLAATDLFAGQVLPREAVRSELIPGRGEAVVGMPVGPGQLPATPLRPRDEVLVIRSDDAASTVRATVLQVGSPDSSGRRTIDVLVQEGQVPSLARAATDDQTLLVLVARR